MNEDTRREYLRQIDLVNPSELDFPILVIGAGGIGSWATFALAKMGCPDITVLDFDNVELHNLPSQLYVEQHIGLPKVKSLQTIIRQFTGTEINSLNQSLQDYIAEDNFGPFEVIVCAVDSLVQRREIWESIRKCKSKHSLYLDARMGGELLRMISVNMKDKKEVEKYEERLFAKTEPSQESCTARSIVYNTFICGGIIANTIKRHAKNERIKPNLTYDIPSNTLM